MFPIALHGHMKPVTMVKYNRDGDLIVSTAKEPKINLYRVKDGIRIGTFMAQGAVSSCDINRASTLLATSGFDLRTHLWNLCTGEKLVTIDHPAPARAVAFSHDDRILMSVTDAKMGQPGTVSLFNLPESLGERPINIEFHPFVKFTQPEAILFAEWGPTNDKIYFGSEDGSVSILDVETMKEELTKIPHKEEVRKLHFDATYTTLVTASKDKSAKLLDVRNLDVISTYESDVPLNDASISPLTDQVIIAGGTDAQDVTTQGGQSKFEVKFYHKVYGGSRPMGQIKCHFGTINSVMFHPSGNGFASGSVDGFVKLHTFDSQYAKSPGYTPCWKAAEPSA